MFVKLLEVEMFQNDWLLKQVAEEQIKSRLREAEASRLAKLAIQTHGRRNAYQHSLVRLGEVLSRAGNYLQIEANQLSAFSSSNKLSVGSTHPAQRVIARKHN
jgi:hypothetical protein